MMSRRILRQLRKTLGIEDPEKAFQTLQTLAADENCPEELRHLAAHFKDFVESVQEAYHDDEEKVRLAIRNLEISSEELNSANATLYRLNIANKAMLESLGQGLLFFDEAGICAPVFSQACLSLLEVNPEGKHIADILSLKAEKRENFETLISLMFAGDAMALSFEDLINMAPQSYKHSSGLHIALSYKPMRDIHGKIMGVLLVATDITHKIKTQEELAEKALQVSRTLRIAGNRSNFVHTLQSFQAVFDTLESGQNLGDFKRDLHTLKGMVRVFYLDDLAALLHDLEDAVEQLPHENWKDALCQLVTGYRPRLDNALTEATDLAREIWGDDFEGVADFISVGTDKLYDFGQTMQTELAADKPDAQKIISRYFDQIASVSALSELDFFETQLTYFSEVADKRINVTRHKGEDVRIFPEIYSNVFGALTHVARNVIDHAFEPPAHRSQLGKPPALQVSIKVSYTDDRRQAFVVEIADDGKGISALRMAERLRKIGLDIDPKKVPASRIIQHVFDEGVSTSAAVDIDSGRGIGMSVIKREAERLGGRVWVDSQEGVGTILKIELPVLWQKP